MRILMRLSAHVNIGVAARRISRAAYSIVNPGEKEDEKGPRVRLTYLLSR